MTEKKQPSLSGKQYQKSCHPVKQSPILDTCIILSINIALMIFAFALNDHPETRNHLLDNIIGYCLLIPFPLAVYKTWSKYLRINNKPFRPLLFISVLYFSYYGIATLFGMLLFNISR